ncbi:T9SS type A sorting domain-containing protein [bacterium]|nr:T9SS type A sorting domain-containing protein [bacterium]MBU1984713.1 T9SS type A sorting domain-containing protein [bacterium]
MHRRTTRQVWLIVLLSLVVCGSANAEGKIAIDWLHGQPSAESLYLNPDLAALYPDFRFVLFEPARMPMYEILAEGVLIGNYADSVFVDVPSRAEALYVVILRGAAPEAYTFVQIVAPDQSITPGAYGMSHLDNPSPGRYTIRFGYHVNGQTYRIGIGPHLWDVYPPEDYDAVVDFHSLVWMLFQGESPPRSDYDIARLQQFLNVGGGIGLFYDGSEPVAEKPIIRLRDFTDEGATVRLDPPGYVSYTLPQPKSARPLTWEIPPTSADVELDYEVAFHRPLNFVSPGSHRGEFVNQSWAIVRDVKTLRFTKNAGYSISEIGTLLPTEKGVSFGGASLPYEQARARLDATLREEAQEAGMLREDIESFFTKYDWAARLLGQAGKSQGVLVVYRLEGEDYDALFPLTADPTPAEMHRVLWVYSILPDHVTAVHSVHPPVAAVPATPATRIAGVYHEYGFFRETYGGDALDEMDAWGWHFYDDMLIDTSDQYPHWWGAYYFDTWGASPLVARLSLGVNRLLGFCTSGIVPAAGTSEVVLSGDEDTRSEFPDGHFPAGSYPPVVVARQEVTGGRLIGTGDLAFFADSADNRQFMQNILEWLCEGATGGGPDIDIAVAVIETCLVEDETAVASLAVWNVGNAPLTLTTTIPLLQWFTAVGPTQAEIVPGEAAHYDLQWSAVDVTPGYHDALWTFTSNDPNESTLTWPVRLRVLASASAGPENPDAFPARFELLPAYPNPFNSSTTLSFTLPGTAQAKLNVYDLQGRLVRVLVDRESSAGRHSVHFDAGTLPSGFYFVGLSAGGHTAAQKLLLLK